MKWKDENLGAHVTTTTRDETGAHPGSKTKSIWGGKWFHRYCADSVADLGITEWHQYFPRGHLCYHPSILSNSCHRLFRSTLELCYQYPLRGEPPSSQAHSHTEEMAPGSATACSVQIIWLGDVIITESVDNCVTINIKEQIQITSTTLTFNLLHVRSFSTKYPVTAASIQYYLYCIKVSLMLEDSKSEFWSKNLE